MVAYAWNPSTEAGRSLQIPGQPGLHNKTLSPPKNLKNSSSPLGMPFVIFASLFCQDCLPSPPWTREAVTSSKAGASAPPADLLQKMALFRLLVVAHNRVYKARTWAG